MPNDSQGADKIAENNAISIIAHEIRSPLTAIKGYLCAIKDGVISAENQAQYINIAINEANRATKLLEELMSLTKLDSGNITPVAERFDINELIRLSIIEKLNDLEQKSISVQTDLASEQLFVNADKSMIQQVLVNLIDNAIKYNNVGGKIKLSSAVQNNKVIVAVEDNGIGIEQDMLPHIWKRFYQADPSNGIAYKGHGLGLCIVKEILLSHGEDISVQSTVGIGSVFSFTLKPEPTVQNNTL